MWPFSDAFHCLVTSGWLAQVESSKQKDILEQLLVNNNTLQYTELLHSDSHLLVSIFIHFSIF